VWILIKEARKVMIFFLFSLHSAIENEELKEAYENKFGVVV
jgi:hypothetical protein